MKFFLCFIFCVALALAPMLFAQQALQRPPVPDQFEISTTNIYRDTDWGKMLAFIGVISAVQVLIQRLVIKPAIRSEMDKFTEKFATRESFNIHERNDAAFQKRVDDFMDHERWK